MNSNDAPQRNKLLVYLAFGLTAIGAIMAIIPTVRIILPDFELTVKSLFGTPYLYIAIAGLILVTIGLILQRKITPEMKITEVDKYRGRVD